MKLRILFLICFLMMVSICYAAIDDIGSFYWTPITKTDSNILAGAKEIDTVVWTPASGNKIVLLGVKFSTDTAQTLLIETGSTAVIPIQECTASGQIVIGNGTPIWKGAINETLTYTTSKNGTRTSLLLWGYEQSN